MKSRIWNDKWIPFTDSEGDCFCVDLDPAKGGRIGQVLYIGCYDGRAVKGRSLSEWLAKLAGKLKRGKFKVAYGTIWLQDLRFWYA